ncbi:hypothetical protein FEM08_28290 [Flavobacterium gilvum]|nr:hypothetical protein FEM08_28290 [Flavobacterium gilvum]
MEKIFFHFATFFECFLALRLFVFLSKVAKKRQINLQNEIYLAIIVKIIFFLKKSFI